MRYQVLMIATLVTAGCQTEPRMHAAADAHAMVSTPKCQAKDNDASCKILVQITPDPKNPGGCQVKVEDSQDPVGFKRGAKDKWIHWEIDAAPPGRYQFTSAGITPKDSSAAKWDENFKNGISYGNGRSFKWKNRNEASDVYDYMVIVVNEFGVSCKQDPRINNQ